MNGNNPVDWWVIDNAFTPIKSMSDIPPKSWVGWEARYENDLERGKRTIRDLTSIPWAEAAIASMRAQVGNWAQISGIPLEDDPTLHGGGLHVTDPGGHLCTHLDYDLHPIIKGKRRAFNLIAFLHPQWKEAWGGALVLTDPMGKVVQRIEPKPGRLVAFVCNDVSYHGVERVTGSASRVSTAVYFLTDATEANTRRRALFMPNRELK